METILRGVTEVAIMKQIASASESRKVKVYLSGWRGDHANG